MLIAPNDFTKMVKNIIFPLFLLFLMHYKPIFKRATWFDDKIWRKNAFFPKFYQKYAQKNAFFFPQNLIKNNKLMILNVKIRSISFL